MRDTVPIDRDVLALLTERAKIEYEECYQGGVASDEFLDEFETALDAATAALETPPQERPLDSRTLTVAQEHIARLENDHGLLSEQEVHAVFGRLRREETDA